MVPFHIVASEATPTPEPSPTPSPSPSPTPSSSPTPDVPSTPDIPKTGDGANPLLWMLMVLAGVGMLTVLGRMRRNTE